MLPSRGHVAPHPRFDEATSRFAVFYCRVAAAAAPTASQKAADVWGRLEPPGIGGLSSQYTPPESGSAEPTGEAPGLYSPVRGSVGTGSEDWRPASAGSACEGSAETCASFSGGCQVLLGRCELSASFSGSTMASFLGICMLLVCAAAVLNRWPGLHCISKYICGVRLLNSKSSGRTSSCKLNSSRSSHLLVVMSQEFVQAEMVCCRRS